MVNLLATAAVIGGVVGYWATVEMLFVGDRRIVGMLACREQFKRAWKRHSRDSN